MRVKSAAYVEALLAVTPSPAVSACCLQSVRMGPEMQGPLSAEFKAPIWAFLVIAAAAGLFQ